ncbi:DUF11 domain-containing protein [Micromonospora sp. DR5-3]|uniref:SdrD B-like domain-containing protein n=1 Tax=unclassified Micromonospora TaxID=2617518 RepID=UPI00165217C6|nr:MULTISPECIES: SdrD B-like domain-containing protein [unclassified Micromonospora]MCW3819585.1 DUF11 domain-containing protein [Micromonospora sp. DR5-3]
MSILRRRPGASLALIALSASLGAVATAVPASAALNRADLSIDLTVSPTRIPLNGKLVTADIHVANAGAAIADGIALTIETPAPISGEGLATDSPWQCVLGQPIQCTHPALAAGESATPLSLPIRLSEGSDGQSVAITAIGTTTSRESSTKNNFDSQSVTYDASIVYPDLYVESAVPIPGYQVIEGDWVKYPMRFGNAGNIAADDVRAHVVAAPGLFGGVGNQSDPSWQCSTIVDGQEWDCVNGPLAVGAMTPVLSFSGRVPAGGQPGERLPVTVTLSTSIPDEDPARSVYEGGFEYGTPAYISGRVWLDADQNGQRDAEESNTPELDQLSVSLLPADANAPVSVSVNADGTYRMPVHAGQYQVEAAVTGGSYRFTTPDVGDDATDSDVQVTYDSSDYMTAQSDPVNIAEGGEAILDIGLITVG